MTTQLYTVTVTDIGTYRVNVAADTPAEAESISKTVLCEEATTLPLGMSRRLPRWPSSRSAGRRTGSHSTPMAGSLAMSGRGRSDGSGHEGRDAVR